MLHATWMAFWRSGRGGGPAGGSHFSSDMEECYCFSDSEGERICPPVPQETQTLENSVSDVQILSSVDRMAGSLSLSFFHSGLSSEWNLSSTILILGLRWCRTDRQTDKNCACEILSWRQTPCTTKVESHALTRTVSETIRIFDLWCVVYVQLLTWIRHLPHRIRRQMSVKTTANKILSHRRTSKIQQHNVIHPICMFLLMIPREN